MTLLSILRIGLRLCACVFFITFAFIVTFATLQPLWEIKLPTADLIVVLGGGMSDSGKLHPSSTVRVDRGVQIYKAGAANRIHFTGGVGKPDGPSAGAQMAKRAVHLGVPIEAISFEGKSHSTLQNALFSQPEFIDLKHIVLVTEGFHLPRSWLSFKAFGANKITLVHARRFRSTLKSGAKMVLRETLAVWFNVFRLGVWKASALWQPDQEKRNALLY